jgi:hypothetical protein
LRCHHTQVGEGQVDDEHVGLKNGSTPPTVLISLLKLYTNGGPFLTSPLGLNFPPLG